MFKFAESILYHAEAEEKTGLLCVATQSCTAPMALWRRKC